MKFRKRRPRHERSDHLEAPIDFCITAEALRAIEVTVGSLPPETGAKLFGPIDKIGVSHVEFDEGGSAKATGSVYAPDAAWGTDRVNHWLDAESPLLWQGDVHSHPGDMAEPSPKVGKGLGDLGYVEQVFKLNPLLTVFLMPIVCQSVRVEIAS